MKEQQTFTLPTQGLSRAKDILKIIPICRSTLWRMVKEDKFPKPIKLSSNITAWRNADVLAWLEQHSTPVRASDETIN